MTGRAAPEIRDAEPGDAASIADLLIASITELCREDHGDDPAQIAEWTANKTPENVQRWIDAPGMVALVALGARRGEMRIAGVAMGDARGTVHLNYVSPDYRFSGVSASLLAGLERRLDGLGVTTARLETTITARRFYLARGWTPAGGECSLEKRLSSQ